MPILQVHMLKGRTAAQKRKLAQALTQAVVAALGSAPEAVRVIMSDMAYEDYAIGGKLVLDTPDKQPKKKKVSAKRGGK